MKQIINKQMIKSRVKKSKYSVPDKVLDKLVDLFRLWGIREKDWTLITEHALQRHGYRVIDTYKPTEIDLIIKKNSLPWTIKRTEWSTMPPRRSIYFRSLIHFTSSTGFTPDLKAFPFGPWTNRQIYKSTWYQLPSRRKIRIQTPITIVQAYIEHLKSVTPGQQSNSFIDQWTQKARQIYRCAMEKHDQTVIIASQEFIEITKSICRNRHTSVGYAESIKGVAIGEGVLCGIVRIIHYGAQMSSFKRGEILVSEDTNPIFLPLMRKVKAIVTDRGGITSHAATLAREFRIPAVIGTKVATKVLKTGDRVEVNTKTGVVKKI